MLDDLRFYVYAYLDPRKPGNYRYGEFSFDHEPFYIGKGSRTRFRDHLKDWHWQYRVSAAMTGLKKSPEHAQYCRIANLGKHHTVATRRHLAKRMRGRFVSEETKAKQRRAALGRRHTAESKAKISASKLGRHVIFSKLHREHLRLARLGRIMPLVTKTKISETKKRQHFIHFLEAA